MVKSFVTVIHFNFRALVIRVEEHQRTPVNMEIIEVNEKKDGTDIDYYNNVSNNNTKKISPTNFGNE